MIILSYYLKNDLFQQVFTLRVNASMGRIADCFICVWVLVVPMSRSNDCDMSKAVYKKATQHYVINCMSKNLTALPREIDSSVTQL